MLGIDVSENNTYVDLDAVVAEGYEDSKFRGYAKAAIDHGLNCGFYSYYSWCTDGHVDAEYLKSCGLPFWHEVPIDWSLFA